MTPSRCARNASSMEETSTGRLIMAVVGVVRPQPQSGSGVTSTATVTYTARCPSTRARAGHSSGGRGRAGRAARALRPFRHRAGGDVQDGQHEWDHRELDPDDLVAGVRQQAGSLEGPEAVRGDGDRRRDGEGRLQEGLRVLVEDLAVLASILAQAGVF